MSVQPSNIGIPLSPGSGKPPQSALFADLNQLTDDIVSPEIESLFSALSTQLEVHLESINNDQDAMHWIDIKDQLKNSESSIKEEFLRFLTKNDDDNPKQESGELTLKLLDDTELDHRLLWMLAANKFCNGENAERILRIKSCLESEYPSYEGTRPATPERLCESFACAIEKLHPNHDIEQQLLAWFVAHLQKVTDNLWMKVEQLLINKGLKPEQNTPIDLSKSRNSLAHEQCSASVQRHPSHKHSPPSQNPYPDMGNSQFLNTFANEIIFRSEDMLAEDELILEAKAHRVKVADLTKVLSILQLEIIEQHRSIKNLHNSVIDALEAQEINSKLSRHHEDLINIIDWLFEFILKGHILPNEIKKTITLLQITILKQVILDDNFLTNHEHPTRLLLNALTSAGIQFYQDSKLGEHVLTLIEHTVHTIISDHSEKNPKFLQECLDEFQYNLNIILQPWHEDQEQQNYISEYGKPLPEESEQNNNIADFKTELMLEDNIELEEEIVLSSAKPNISPQNILLAETLAEIGEAPTEPEIIEDEASREQKIHHSTSGPVITEELHPGQWVEFIGEGNSHSLRCKLARLSRDSRCYIFVNRSGMCVAERSGSELKKGIKNGSIRILEEGPFFDRAIRAILKMFKKH